MSEDASAAASDGIRLGRLEEFPVGKGVSVDLDEFPVPLAVFNLGEEIHVLPDSCPHKGAPLSRTGTEPPEEGDPGTYGKLDAEAKTVSCPWHGLKFDLETGDCPATSYRLRPLDVEVVDGEVLLKR